MLVVNVIPLAIDETFSVFDRMNVEVLNQSAQKMADDLKEKFKGQILADRKATITIKVDKEKGLVIERDFQRL